MSNFLIAPRFYIEAKTDKLIEAADWGLKSLGVPDIWSYTMGKGIKVCVLDTGIDRHHPDLAGAISDEFDFTNSASGVRDNNGHGTHVAGIIAARSNGIGVIGVAPESELLVGRVLNDRKEGTVKQLIEGIRWAIDKNADIISMSLGGNDHDPDLEKIIKEAFDKKIILVAGAGNEGRRDFMRYPAQFKECIAVGSVDRNLMRSTFSNGGNELDIMAPGEKIYSTFLDRSYTKLVGTSMAAPYVAGVCALILSKHRMHGGSTPVNGTKDMLDHLVKYARDMGTPDFDTETGRGLIEPKNAFFEQNLRRELALKYQITYSSFERIYLEERNRGVKHKKALKMAIEVSIRIGEIEISSSKRQ